MHTSQKQKRSSLLYDTIIIGAGPAGLSCAMQARRQGLSIALLEKDCPGGQALAANWVENYPGFPSGISGRNLMAHFIEQAKRHGIKINKERVTSAKKDGSSFVIETEHDKWMSKTLVVACGLKPKLLGIPGEKERIGKTIFAYVDPALVPHKNKIVKVVGSGDAAFDQALNFSKKAKSVSITMKNDKPHCLPILFERAINAGIKILPSCKLETLDDIGADILVVCIGKEAQTDFLQPPLPQWACPLKVGERAGERVFWAGDCLRGKNRHIAIAAGDGIAAAIKVFKCVSV